MTSTRRGESRRVDAAHHDLESIRAQLTRAQLVPVGVRFEHTRARNDQLAGALLALAAKILGAVKTLKLSARPPPAAALLMNDRRVRPVLIVVMLCLLFDHRSCRVNGLFDANIGTTAAQITLHGGINIGIRWRWI